MPTYLGKSSLIPEFNPFQRVLAFSPQFIAGYSLDFKSHHFLSSGELQPRRLDIQPRFGGGGSGLFLDTVEFNLGSLLLFVVLLSLLLSLAWG